MDLKTASSTTRKLTFSNFIKFFIKLNKEFKTNGSDSFSFNIISLFFYFSHLMSYIILYDSHSEEDQKFHILNNIIFFSNHTNLIIYIENVPISILIYSITVCLLLFIGFYVPFLMISKKIWRKGFDGTKLLSFFNNLFVFLLNAFYWCLLQPSLDLMLKAAFCKEDSSHFLKNKMICFSNQFLIIFFSILSCLLILFFAIVNLLLNENFLFSEKSSLNINRARISQLVLFGLRIMISLINVLDYDSRNFIHIAVHIFFLLSIVDYLQFLPFRNPHYNTFYFGLLVCCELFALLLSSFEFFFILSVKSFFFSFFPVSLLLFKLSSIIYQRKNNRQYFSFAKNNINNEYLQEEILYLFEKENGSQQCYFILVGLLRKISKGKEKKHAELRNSILNNQYHNLSSRDRFKILSNYVSENFQNMIYSNIKNTKGKRETEMSILKYISFLLKGNATALKTFFEYLKIKSMMINPSSLFEIKSRVLFDEIVLKIGKIQSEMKKSNLNLNMDESTILASDFFHLEKKRKVLLRKMNETILSKMDFYEKLNNGFESYDEMLIKLGSSAKRIQDLKRHLDKTPDIISLKFYSIFNCIILNFLPLALKNEDEIENIKKKYYKNEHDKLTPNLIFSPSIAIFQISFLSVENKILESSKTESLARFFGFSRSEFSSLNNINLLMPKFIAKIHRKIIENSFQKSRKTNYKDNISVLAINKQGFCFPVQIFFSNCFEFDDDFVLNTLIRRRNSLQKHILLADSDYLIANASEETFRFLNFFIVNLTPSDLNFFKLYHLIPETKQLLNEESLYKQSKKVLQKEGAVLIPEFIDEIIEILRIKRHLLDYYQENSKTNTSAQSFKTMRSLHSENKRRECDKLLVDFLSRNTLFCQKFDGTLAEWMKNNSLQPSDLLENFYATLELREFKIVFNLEMKTVYLDETNSKNNSLQYIELYIDKLGEENKDGSIISESKIDFFGIPTYRNTKINVNFPDVKTESNHNVNLDTSECFIENDFRNILNIATQNKLNLNAEAKISYDSESDNKEQEDRKSSNNVSSVGVGSLRKNLIEIQKNLMNSLPYSVSVITLLLIIQLALVFLFALLIFLLSNNYLNNYYYLLHETMIEQSSLNLAFRYGGIIITQNELESSGFIKRDEFTKQKQKEVLENLAVTAKTILNKFRDQDRNFLYEKHLKSSITKSLDLRTETIRNVTFSDLMDSFLENMNYFINRSSTTDTTVTKFVGRNMPYYLEASKVNRDLGQLEFLDSKQLISSQLVNVLVAASIFIFAIKIIEFLNFIKLQGKLAQLMNIPLRITQHESRKELLFLREIISKAKSAVFPFLSLSFTEHLLKKDEIYESEKNLNILADDRLSNSKKKKVRNLSIRAFSKKSLWVYLTLSLILIGSYGIVNYIFIMDTQNKITNLISFNVMTNNLNLYTGNIVGLTLFQMRDKLLMEKEYDKLKEDLQNMKFRQTFFYNRFTGRITDLKLYIHAMPGQYTEAKANLDKSFDELVNGDVCKELVNRAELEEDWEFFCRKALNGGFNSGIIGALNEYLNFVNQVEEYVRPRNNEDAAVVLKENQKIIKIFNESDYKNIVLESYILVKALRVFLNVMKDYYSNTLNTNIKTLEIINFVSCFMTFVILAGLVSSWMRKNRTAYRDCVWGLGMIPYEKIVNDEQTNFLIKQFNKEI